MITLQERVHGVALPDNWKLAKLHRVLRVRKGNKNVGMQEDNLLSLSYGRIVRKDIDSAEGLLPESFETYQIVEPGNIVMRLTDLQNDKRSLRQGLVRERGIITAAYDALEVDKGHDPRFWAYMLFAVDLAKYYYSLGGGVRQSIKFADFPNEWVRAPERAVQKSIADFLDCESARIDQLIEKKQRFVDLVSCRFDTEVRLAVTHGRSGAELKPSGVNYLGEVPRHWSVEKMGRRYTVQLGKMLDAAKQTGEHLAPYLRVADVQWDEIHIEDLPMMDFSPADRRKFELRQGDLIVNEGGSYVGRSAIWKGELNECYYQKALHRVRPRNPSVDTADFFLWVMWFATKAGVFVANGNQTTIDHLTAEAFRRYHFAFPPIEEQHRIASSLRAKRTQDMTLSEVVVKSIERLRDFKVALITAAVTGQIQAADWAKRGEVDRQLDEIQKAMRA